MQLPDGSFTGEHAIDLHCLFALPPEAGFLPFIYDLLHLEVAATSPDTLWSSLSVGQHPYCFVQTLANYFSPVGARQGRAPTIDR